MQKIFRILMLMLVTALAACGGGGGDGGSPGGNPNQPDLVTTAGDLVRLDKGAMREFQISGGVPPYRVVNPDPSIAVVTVDGNTLRISAKNKDESIPISVMDYSGASTTIGVVVGLGTPPAPPVLFSTAPASLDMLNGSTREFDVVGGTAPYTASSANVGVATATISPSNKLVITAVGAGQTTIQISDRASPEPTTLSISVTVTVPLKPKLFSTAPEKLNILNGVTRDFEVIGGTTPYTVSSVDVSVATASISNGRLSITATGAGKTNIVVSDRAVPEPATLSIEVNVGSSTEFFINAPGTVTLTLESNERYAYQLSGGTQFPSNPRYTVVSSDSSVARGVVEGTTLVVTPLKVGTATMQLKDAVGKAIELEVTVVSTAPVTPPGSTDPVVKAPVISSARLLGTSDNSISASGYTTLEVTLLSPSGRGIPNQLIKVEGDQAQVIFPEGNSGLTNASGVANIKLARASLTATGAGSLTVTYSYKSGTLLDLYPNTSVVPPTVDTVVSTYVGYQLATANITLDNLNVGAGSLPAYGTRQVSVQVNLNGVPTTTPVQVNFSATCGQVSPATASTNAQGQVTVSYSATDAAGAAQSSQGCSGKTVEISASTIGATVKSATLTVTGAPATNMAFVSATPTRIYLANSGGPTQSLVKFKLINAQGEPIVGRDVKLELKTLAGGTIDATKATFETVGKIVPVTKPTDSNGEVSVPVFSGTVPTSVLVHATLVPLLPTDPTIETDSAVLTIASGRPAQARTSLSIEKLAIEGANLDGDESKVTMSLADRQGNPVPDGTAVNFVTEGGVMIPPVCTTGTKFPGDSQCTVTIRSQNPRPTAGATASDPTHKGRVSILAYAAGEEDFNDANFNNVYDCNESWQDLGTAFRDDNEDSVFNQNIEFSVPRQMSATLCGTQAKTPSPGNAMSMPGSITQGDGVWGTADVRERKTIIFATSNAKITDSNFSYSGGKFNIADENGNSMPTGSKITVTAVPAGSSKCAIAAGAAAIIPNQLGPLSWPVSLKDCGKDDTVTIEVETLTTRTVTPYSVKLP